VSNAQIAAIAAGQGQPDLCPGEAVAYNVAAAQAGNKHRTGSTYQAAVDMFGVDRAGQLVSLIRGYCFV